MQRNFQNGSFGVAVASRQTARVAECLTIIILIEDWATERAYSQSGLYDPGSNGCSTGIWVPNSDFPFLRLGLW
jgi:hypothetical protein